MEELGTGSFPVPFFQSQCQKKLPILVAGVKMALVRGGLLARRILLNWEEKDARSRPVHCKSHRFGQLKKTGYHGCKIGPKVLIRKEV